MDNISPWEQVMMNIVNPRLQPNRYDSENDPKELLLFKLRTNWPETAGETG